MPPSAIELMTYTLPKTETSNIIMFLCVILIISLFSFCDEKCNKYQDLCNQMLMEFTGSTQKVPCAKKALTENRNAFCLIAPTISMVLNITIILHKMYYFHPVSWPPHCICQPHYIYCPDHSHDFSCFPCAYHICCFFAYAPPCRD